MRFTEIQGNAAVPDGAPRSLSPMAYAAFNEKGEGNSVKVRRVMQITRNFAPQGFDKLRILDLGCGEGVYSIEAGLKGAEVLALDGRPERLSQGTAIAKELGLSRVKFAVEDVRRISKETLGEFDVVYFLGLMYHLYVPDVFHVMERIHDLCRHCLIIDTHIALDPQYKVNYKNSDYLGWAYKEHDESTSMQDRAKVQRSSLDNVFSFWFSRESLVRLMFNVGFTSVMEYHSPIEGNKPADRVTLVGIKGPMEQLSTYPWINGMAEEEIAKRVGAPPPPVQPQSRP